MQQKPYLCSSVSEYPRWIGTSRLYRGHGTVKVSYACEAFNGGVKVAMTTIMTSDLHNYCPQSATILYS